MGSYELSDRSRRVLATLVREYIETGEPVSSQVLAARKRPGVSSATVRNVLAQLEEAATCISRTPRPAACRPIAAIGVFVDLLLESRRPAGHRCREPAAPAGRRIAAHGRPAGQRVARGVARRAARRLRAWPTARGGAAAHRVRPARRTACWWSWSSRAATRSRRKVDRRRSGSSDDLVQAANYLNTEFAGLPLLDVRERCSARLQQERTLYDRAAGARCGSPSRRSTSCRRQQTFHVEARRRSLARAAHDGVSLDTLRALLEMMEEKERLVHLLNRYIDGPGLTVVIGAEHTLPDLRRSA